MQIAEAVKSAFRKLFTFGEQSPPLTSELTNQQSGLQQPVTSDMFFSHVESMRNDRRSIMKDIRKMVRSDPRIGRIIEKLAADSSANGFEVTVQDAPTEALQVQAQDVIDNVSARLKLVERLPEWTEALLEDGDLFLQRFVDSHEMETSQIKALAAEITWPNMTPQGEIADPNVAFYQEHPWTRERVQTFAKWQVVHRKWKGRDGKPLGKPMFAAARLPWNRLQDSEYNIVVRRAIGSGNILVHNVGTSDNPGLPDKVDDYRRDNADSLENPLKPLRNFYGDGTLKIESLEGDKQLDQLSDLFYFLAQVIVASGIPMALIGGGQEAGINRDVLEKQWPDYLLILTYINERFEVAFKEIFEFEMLLKGMNPESFKIGFNWGEKDADSLDQKVERAAALQEIGMSFRTIFEQIGLDGITFDAEIERIKAQIEDGTIPYGINIKAQNPVIEMLKNLQLAPETAGKKPLDEIPLDPYNTV